MEFVLQIFGQGIPMFSVTENSIKNTAPYSTVVHCPMQVLANRQCLLKQKCHILINEYGESANICTLNTLPTVSTASIQMGMPCSLFYHTNISRVPGAGLVQCFEVVSYSHHCPHCSEHQFQVVSYSQPSTKPTWSVFETFLLRFQKLKTEGALVYIYKPNNSRLSLIVHCIKYFFGKNGLAKIQHYSKI